MKKLTDIEIIESVIKGNVNDFTLLIDRYKHKAFSLLVNILKNKMDAEEALQDSFIKAFNSLDAFRRESQFSTWFYKIVYNTGLTIISAKKRKIEMEMSSIDDLYFLKDEDNEVYSMSENKKEYLIKMVDKLPVRNSLVLILFYLDNLSLKEISEVLDLSLVNCKVLLHRSRNLLRDLLIQHNYQEELL
ncbi:MAG: sigma-70 family RNA polymerase sigma factor [Ignavibacteriae bacterium]|nr:sigma-70 family RNA polymerase sigma factor [Ignavibacteriota bacterium]